MPDNSFHDRLSEDLKQAMRDKDKVRLRTLRSLRAALQNKEIDHREDGDGEQLTEQEQLAVLQKQISQREDSIEQYEKAGRDDLVDKEQDEIEVLKEYRPDPLSEDELERRVKDIVAEVGAESMADMGPVMGRAMDALRGYVDGNRVREKVQDLLGE